MPISQKHRVALHPCKLMQIVRRSHAVLSQNVREIRDAAPIRHIVVHVSSHLTGRLYFTSDHTAAANRSTEVPVVAGGITASLTLLCALARAAGVAAKLLVS